MRVWLKTARDPAIVRCSMKYAFVVGPVLVAINYGDTIVQGRLSGADMVKIILTMLVPYMVSTFSSVGTMCRMQTDTTSSTDEPLK